MSSEREELKRAFLRAAGLGDAKRELLSGDASTRQYERLAAADGTSLIFMDQPPAVESVVCPPGASAAERMALGYKPPLRAGGERGGVQTTAAYLRDHGLSAPRCWRNDVDRASRSSRLGDGLYATLIADGAPETPLYEAAVDAQVLMRA